MVIYVSSPGNSLQNTTQEITSMLQSAGHVVIGMWANQHEQRSVTEVFQRCAEEIDRAEVVIIEGSAASFNNGFVLATALTKKKPCLLLVDQAADKNEDALSAGVTDPLCRRIVYATQQLPAAIEQFIRDNLVTTKELRFNFVIDRQMYNHLRAQATKYGKTKAEVVRDLLMKDITNN